MNETDNELGLSSNLHQSLNESSSPPWVDQSKENDVNQDKPELPRTLTLTALADKEFYKRDDWFYTLCDILFKLKRRNTTVEAEVYYGLIHYISCLYCLAVIPQQLKNAGYSSRPTVVSVALCSGIGSIICGLFANLPFVLAPPTVVSIFLSVYLQQMNETSKEGNLAVILSGAFLVLFGWRPLGRFVSKLIPIPIQVGTAVGIGLLTALAGSTEINLVVSGTYTILKIGKITSKIVIAFFGVILISVATKYHIKGAFCIAVVLCSLIWWIYDDDWPGSIAAAPYIDVASTKNVRTTHTALLTIDLVFLYVSYLNGLMTSLSNLAVLTRQDRSIPRGRWIYIMAGIFTVLSGAFSSAPILVSPESSASIKEGAKTGLSAVVAGILFVLSSFFSPIFEDVPSAGTSPVLIMIGVILIQNVGRIDWRDITSAAPAFVVLFYIPFTYSIIQGVILGYIVYIAITLFSGELKDNTIDLLLDYFPHLDSQLTPYLTQNTQNPSQSMPSERRTQFKNSVFDDHDGDHIIGADMSMSMFHSDPSNSDLTTTKSFPADFGTEFGTNDDYRKSCEMKDATL